MAAQQKVKDATNMIKKAPKGSGSILGLLFAAGGIAWGAQKCLFPVQGGERAVVFNKFFGLKETIYGEGTHFYLPGVEEPFVFNVRVSPTRRSSQTGSKDLQIVKVNIRILHKPEATKLVQIVQQLGMDYAQRVLPSIANEVLASTVAQFTASQLITKREEVSSIIKQKLTERAQDFHLVLDDVSITHLTFASEYMAAVEAKQVAQQEAQRAQFIVEKALQDKEEIIVRAEGEAVSAELFNEQLASDTSGNFLQLRRLEAATEIAAVIAQGGNKVYLSADQLLLDSLANKSSAWNRKQAAAAAEFEQAQARIVS